MVVWKWKSKSKKRLSQHRFGKAWFLLQKKSRRDDCTAWFTLKPVSLLWCGMGIRSQAYLVLIPPGPVWSWTGWKSFLIWCFLIYKMKMLKSTLWYVNFCDLVFIWHMVDTTLFFLLLILVFVYRVWSHYEFLTHFSNTKKRLYY